MKKRSLLLAAGLIGLAGLAYAQGQALLTTLVGDEIVAVQSPRSPYPTGITVNNFNGFGQGAAGGFTISPRLFATCGASAEVSTAGTNQTPVATEVYIAEIWVPANVTVTGVSILIGSVASGNLKVGLASSAGAVLATSASTSIVGTDVYLRVPFTTALAVKGPATYYVLSFIDNATARMNAHAFGSCGTAVQTGQVYATGFTAITPPTTFTADVGPIASLY